MFPMSSRKRAKRRFRRVRFQTPSSVSFLALSELRGEHSASSSQPNYLCAKANSPSFWQNSPSLPQNSVSSLLRNSPIQTAFHPFPIKPPSAGTWIICWKIQTQMQRERPTLQKPRCIHILREIAPRVRQVIDIFGYCELQCQECGEVLVTNFMTICPGENLQASLPPKNPPQTSPSKTSNFTTVYF